MLQRAYLQGWMDRQGSPSHRKWILDELQLWCKSEIPDHRLLIRKGIPLSSIRMGQRQIPQQEPRRPQERCIKLLWEILLSRKIQNLCLGQLSYRRTRKNGPQMFRRHRTKTKRWRPCQAYRRAKRTRKSQFPLCKLYQDYSSYQEDHF